MAEKIWCIQQHNNWVTLAPTTSNTIEQAYLKKHVIVPVGDYSIQFDYTNHCHKYINNSTGNRIPLLRINIAPQAPPLPPSTIRSSQSEQKSSQISSETMTYYPQQQISAELEEKQSKSHTSQTQIISKLVRMGFPTTLVHKAIQQLPISQQNDIMAVINILIKSPFDFSSIKEQLNIIQSEINNSNNISIHSHTQRRQQQYTQRPQVPQQQQQQQQRNRSHNSSMIPTMSIGGDYHGNTYNNCTITNSPVPRTPKWKKRAPSEFSARCRFDNTQIRLYNSPKLIQIDFACLDKHLMHHMINNLPPFIVDCNFGHNNIGIQYNGSVDSKREIKQHFYPCANQKIQCGIKTIMERCKCNQQKANSLFYKFKGNINECITHFYNNTIL